MAEEFFKFQDNKEKRISSLSRTFQDFEEEWLQLGHDFSVVFDSGNSPKDPNQSEEKKPTNPKKRKLSETEDSLISMRKKMVKQSQKWGFTQQRFEEDPLLKTFRQENPERYQALEKRTCTKGPPRVTAYSPASPEFSPALSEFNPELQGSPTHVSQEHTTIAYSPTSPEISPMLQGTTTHVSPGHTLTPLQAPFNYTQASSECVSKDYRIDFFTQPSPAQYPLKEELTALGQLIDSVRVDLLQTSMLVNYIQDYFKKWK